MYSVGCYHRTNTTQGASSGFVSFWSFITGFADIMKPLTLLNE